MHETRNVPRERLTRTRRFTKVQTSTLRRPSLRVSDTVEPKAAAEGRDTTTDRRTDRRVGEVILRGRTSSVWFRIFNVVS